jgi:predicted GIY-YIG superfamily endonuclease
MCANKSEALKLELAIKSRPRAEKLMFLKSYKQDEAAAASSGVIL